MATGTIMNNSGVKDISAYITPMNGCTIRDAYCSGNVVQINGTIPASLAGATQILSLSGYRPIGYTNFTTSRTAAHGVIALEGSVGTYYTESVFPSAQNFSVVYLTQ